MESGKLSIGDFGDKVARLHETLSHQGFSVSSEEVKRKFFGPSTRETVREFQKTHGIEPSCKVCQQTADILASNPTLKSSVQPNPILTSISNNDLGAKEVADRACLSSPIIAPLRFGDRSAKVANLQTALLLLLSRNFLGVNAEEQKLYIEGLLREQKEQFYNDYTAKVISIFQNQLKLNTTGEVDRATADELERVWRELCPSSSGDNFIVRGTIRQETSNFPLEGMRVVVVDKYVGGESILGEAITNSQGNYFLSIKEWGKQNPDLQIKVTKPNFPDKVLALSGVLYNAGNQEFINVTVPDAKLELPEEYQRLTNELSLHLGNQNLRFAQLQENGDRQDITYLANKTGWDARMVAMVALADQFSQQNDIPSELYYALFRTGLPANQDILSQINPEMVQQLWNKAIEDKIIPEALKESIPQSLERFKNYSANRLLEQPAQVGVSSFKELLTISLGTDTNRQQRFAQLYYQNRDHLDNLWSSVRQEFGDTVANRLQLDGKLSFLTLNNGNLIEKLHQNNVAESPLDLVRNGFYKHDNLKNLLTQDIIIPAEIPGEDLAERKANYVELMVNQLKLSYPTAVVAEMINNNDVSLQVNSDIKESVYQFLNQHQGKFELGVHPIENYLQKNSLTLVEPVLAQIKQLQRVYQISPSDAIMGKLVEKKLDSAYAIIQYNEREFINTFKDELGGEEIASLTYAKAHQVHHTVLNIATSYLITRTTPEIYALSGFTKQAEINNPTAIIDPTLENLFGEMDYCACEHCRSVLSPAAYLVSLLQFIDLKIKNSKGVELPPTYEKENPIEVLLRRRPDIQHIQLTCENTNTVLPYIDLVNEILEYFVVNNFSLTNFKGYNIEEGVTTEDLLANPQFVNKEAYNRLKEAIFPLSLPFHQPLETLRQYFNSFDIPLHIAMEQLRKNDDFDVQNGINSTDYDWQDILIERLQMSRQEYKAFTDGNITLQQGYGLADTITENQLINLISNAKVFARRVEISYEEVIEITKTKFINPNSDLIPKLEKLRVDFKTIKDFHDGTLVPEDFDKLRTKDSDLILTQYGGDVKKWVRDNYDKIMGLILLSDPTGSEDICSFDKLEFRYALPDFNQNQLKAIEFWKLLRFIRLWKKLGWSIEYIDKAVSVLYPSSQLPETGDNEATIKSKLDVGFRELILRIAHLKTIIEKLNLNPNRELIKLLAVWSNIDTNSSKSLYRQMFLNPTILHLDDVFEEDGYGNYPKNQEEKLAQHIQSLQAAFNLTTEEFELIFNRFNFNEQTKLTLENLSNIFRYSYIAKKLKLSIREFLILQTISGIDPFVPLLFINPNDSTKYQQPAILRFIELAQLIKRSPFKLTQIAYFLQHEDISSKASPTRESILAFTKTIRDDLIRIERENIVQDDPTGDLTKAKMTLVYGNQPTDTFFGLLNGSSLYSVSYNHSQPELDANILAVTHKLTYNKFQKQLSFVGMMTETMRDALKNVASVSNEFKQAIDDLFAKGQAFFNKFPDLRKPYDNYIASSESSDKKMSALLATFLPNLREQLKRLQIKQIVSSQVGTTLEMTNLLLETPKLLHAVEKTDKEAIADFLNLEIRGVSVQYFFTDNVVGIPNQKDIAVAQINYYAGDEKTALPHNTIAPNAPISGIWECYLEVPDNGFYNFYIETDASAEVQLSLERKELDKPDEPIKAEVEVTLQNGIWQNREAIALKAGQLYFLKLIIKKVKDKLILKWESKGLAKESIPTNYLYPSVLVERFTNSYLRLLKIFEIAEALNLSPTEVNYFGTYSDYHINGKGWLNALPVNLLAENAPILPELTKSFIALLHYKELKEALKVQDDRLIKIFINPQAIAEETTTKAPKTILEQITGWNNISLEQFYNLFKAPSNPPFNLSANKLKHLSFFLRIKEAFALAKKLQIQASALLANTTNEPTADIIRNLQSALRAHYERSSWFNVVQPLNNKLRNLQRDALVTFILYQLQQKAETKHINTSDKLFEYFLIDVEMDACMKTSRIKQAISTVQLFIQRCLLNLEKDANDTNKGVSPSSIKAKQWEWMKRYRVWEANRKVFLFPENWLEPELRDNKSPFFKDLESELLQSDITEDSAATALVHYLEKLNEVANLEICGMYYEENELDKIADDIIHVIGRTTGARRKYYYRRLEYGYWTPWEKVDVDIEDNPVLPVVWKGRLFLFWVSVIQKAPPNSTTSTGTDKNINELRVSDLKSIAPTPALEVSVNLYWSEYCNNKWQPPKTSDINKPLLITQLKPGQEKVDPTKLELSSSSFADKLCIDIQYETFTRAHFTLYNTHSLPIGEKNSRKVNNPFSNGSPQTRIMRVLNKTDSSFTITYQNPSATNASDRGFSQKILHRVSPYQIVEQRNIFGDLFYLKDVFEAPFFFQDSRHVFFVRPVESKIFLLDSINFPIGNIPPGAIDISTIPPIILQPKPLPSNPLDPIAFPPERFNPGVVNLSPVRSFLDKNTYINKAIGNVGTISFGDKLIGPSGSLNIEIQSP